jgi:hypothetical protein
VLAVYAAVVFAGCGGDGNDGAASGPRCSSIPTRFVDFDALATTLNASGISASFVAVNTTDVFFAFAGSLMRAPLRGGTPVALAPVDLGYEGALLVTSMGVVFKLRAADHPGIGRVSIVGGTPVTLATTSAEPGPIATDGSTVYFADGTSIRSVPLAGGVTRTLTVVPDASQGLTSAEVEPVTGLAVVGSRLVITETSGTVASVPLTGGTPQTLAISQDNASFPMACGTDTCWWTGPTPSSGSGPGSIERLSLRGETTISGAPFLPWSIAFDGTSFFETVACDTCPGTLMRIPLSGGLPETMGAGGFVAVDDSCAYYSRVSGLIGNGIYSVDKSYAGPGPF